MGTLALSRFEDVKAALDETLHLDHLRDEVQSDSCKAFYFLGGQAYLEVQVNESGPVIFKDYYGRFNSSISVTKKAPLEVVLTKAWLEGFGDYLQEFVSWSKEHAKYRKEVLEKVKQHGIEALNQDELDALEAMQVDEEVSRDLPKPHEGQVHASLRWWRSHLRGPWH